MNLHVIRPVGTWTGLAQSQPPVNWPPDVNEEMPDRVHLIRSYVVREDDGRLGSFNHFRRSIIRAGRSQAQVTKHHA